MKRLVLIILSVIGLLVLAGLIFFSARILGGSNHVDINYVNKEDLPSLEWCVIGEGFSEENPSLRVINVNVQEGLCYVVDEATREVAIYSSPENKIR
jgi:hypothetical protein